MEGKMQLANARNLINDKLKKKITMAVRSIKISEEDSLQSTTGKTTLAIQNVILEHLANSIKDNAPALIHEILATGGKIIGQELAIYYAKDIYQSRSLKNVPTIEDPFKYSFAIKTLKDNIFVLSSIMPIKDPSPGIKETDNCRIETFVFDTKDQAQTEKEKWFEYASSLNLSQNVPRPIKYGVIVTTDITDQKSFSPVFHAKTDAVDSYVPGADGEIIETNYYASYDQAATRDASIEKIQAIVINDKKSKTKIPISAVGH